MKVLFIYTNINTIHPENYHFGLASIISYIKTYHDLSLKIIDNKKDILSIIDFINNYEPDVIGFTCVSSQFFYVNLISREIKKQFKDKIIVCGGVHPTLYPQCILETEYLDGIFIGETEEQFLEFLNKIEKGEDYKTTDNFAYKDDKGFLVKNDIVLKHPNLDVLPCPDRENFDYQKILNESDRMVQVVFSRGCPFNCTYCSNKAIRKVYEFDRNNYIRYRSPENCIKELEQLDNHYNFNKIWIIDDIFGMNKNWLDDFLQQYSERFSFPFMFHLRPNIVTDELMQKIRDAGGYRVLMSIESGNDYIRNSVMKRNISREEIINAFKLAHKYGMETVAPNIIGLPYETKTMITETIKLNAEVNPMNPAVSIFYPYKGSELFNLCVKEGWLDPQENKEHIEKKESILNYPQISKKEIQYYYDNFNYLILKEISLIKALKYKLIFSFKNSPLGKKLRSIKRLLKQALLKIRK